MNPSSIRFGITLISALVLAGCAEKIVTVKQTTPRFATVGVTEPELVAAEDQLRDAQQMEHREPTRALGGYLACAQAASDRLARQPGDVEARNLYDFAVARCVGVIETAPLDPWNHSLSVPGPNGGYVVTTRRGPGPDQNPADYKIIPADTLTIGGTFFKERVTLEGIGAPVVGVGREEKVDAFKSLATKRLYGTATAIIRFNDHRAQIEFLEPFMMERATLNGRTSPLAADFTAALAIAMTTEHPEKLGLARLLRPEKYAGTARLTRLQAYDPNRIPVIFVHGLQDTPASWAPMINALRADREIRRRYQLWVFSYPSGYPYPYAAAIFRKQLDSLDRAFPNHKGIVLVGHSMGGCISRLMITDAGDKLWFSYFGKSPAKTDLPDDARRLLEDSLVFNHRRDVRRVIFMSTPHRGSNIASNWVGRIGSMLVKPPTFFASIPISVITSATADPNVLQLKRVPDSVDTLAPNNRFVMEINKIPIAPGIPFHTIEGDRGKGDAPNSSDGVVPYWSSHVEGAQSELVVPSNHSSPRNSQAIKEVRRILKLHQG